MPPISSVHVLIFITIGSIVIAAIRHDLKKQTLKGIPGPFITRYTSVWLIYQARRGRRYQAVHDLHRRYGPIIHIAPNHISIADKSALPIIYGNGSSAFEKSPFYKQFVADFPSLFSAMDKTIHARKRRIVSHAFSYPALRQFTPSIQSTLETFVWKLDELACPGSKQFNLVMWLNYFTFDVLADLAFGEAMGMLLNGSALIQTSTEEGSIKHENIIKLVEEREHLAAVLGISSAFAQLARFLPDPFLKSGRQSSSTLADFARRQVLQRINTGSSREDILDHILRAHTRYATASTLTKDDVSEIVAETITLLSAGWDTISSSVAAIVHLVVSNTDVHVKLLQELDENVGIRNIPNHDEVKDLPYLRAVIDESLRFHATMASGLPRVVPPKGLEVFGFHIPPGTEVSVPAYTVQRDATIWGDPDTFRPERWFELPDKGQDLTQYLLSFGKGARACIGKQLAYIEMQLITATLFSNYDISLRSDGFQTIEGFVNKALALNVQLTLRQK